MLEARKPRMHPLKQKKNRAIAVVYRHAATRRTGRQARA